jgi:NAD(P)-dependent dehydrogenase (short-subunit alcohol dehydrogenase family)
MNTDANRKENPGVDPSKWVQPDSVAALAAYLASPAGAPITGAAIPVYGQDL